MDNFHPQSTGEHRKEGHDPTDLSIRAIIIFGISLALSGVAAFLLVLGFYWGLQKWRKTISRP